MELEGELFSCTNLKQNKKVGIVCINYGARGRVVFLLYNFQVKRKIPIVLCALSVLIQGKLSSCTNYRSNEKLKLFALLVVIEGVLSSCSIISK